MAAPDAKTEPKVEVDQDEPAEPALTYKTWVLKVSIHCEACKRKVKRILKNVEGVYETDIDLKQQKVVVKGNVESETLIKKLLKTGKHAELWPENPGKKKAKSKKKEKHSDSESSDDSSSQEDDKEKVKFEVPENADVGVAGKPADGGSPQVPAGDAPPAGGKKKKKKKKKKNKGNAGGEALGDAPANPTPAGSVPGHPEPGHHSIPGPSPILANDSPPRHFVTHYPAHFYAPPLYSVRYSTAYAASAQPRSASYYATPQPSSYAVVHTGARPEIDSQPSDNEYSYSSPASDSLEIFSDENPNGCSVM